MSALREEIERSRERVPAVVPAPAPARPFMPTHVLALQRSLGNRASARLLHATAPPRPLLQRKGPEPLITQIATSAPIGLAAWADGLERRPDANFAAIMQRIRDYDALADGRPSAQLAHLDKTIDALIQYAAGPGRDADPAMISRLMQLINDETITVSEEHRRLKRYTAGADAPYEQMTDEGLLWTHKDFAQSASKLKLRGRRYFEKLSADNRAWMREQFPKSFLFGEEKWVQPLLAKVKTALESAVLNHYTTSTRAQTMLTGGGLKSKMMLAKDVAGYRHNTSAYDDYGLANTGFVFFFIEAQGTPLRETRFAQGGKDEAPSDPARISIPIKESGLLTNGWVMLSDFAQREFPTVMTKQDSPTETFSELPTRLKQSMQGKGKGFDTHVRHFEPGIQPVELEEMAADKDQNQERRQARMNVTMQVRGDDRSVMVYGSGKGERRYAERLAQNILVGPDIIPGLAERAVVETSRIAKSNPALAEKIKSLEGPPLLRLLLKDMLRPQAMVPNNVAIEARHIETEGAKVPKSEPKSEPLSSPSISVSSGPTREALMERGLDDLEAIVEEWRKRGNTGNPPRYDDRRHAFLSITGAPAEVTIEQIQEDIATWLQQARDAWVPPLASGVVK